MLQSEWTVRRPVDWSQAQVTSAPSNSAVRVLRRGARTNAVVSKHPSVLAASLGLTTRMREEHSSTTTSAHSHRCKVPAWTMNHKSGCCVKKNRIFKKIKRTCSCAHSSGHTQRSQWHQRLTAHQVNGQVLKWLTPLFLMDANDMVIGYEVTNEFPAD